MDYFPYPAISRLQSSQSYLAFKPGRPQLHQSSHNCYSVPALPRSLITTVYRQRQKLLVGKTARYPGRQKKGRQAGRQAGSEQTARQQQTRIRQSSCRQADGIVVRSRARECVIWKLQPGHGSEKQQSSSASEQFRIPGSTVLAHSSVSCPHFRCHHFISELLHN